MTASSATSTQRGHCAAYLGAIRLEEAKHSRMTSILEELRFFQLSLSTTLLSHEFDFFYGATSSSIVEVEEPERCLAFSHIASASKSTSQSVS